ncbi:hypothetical protein VUR80DRAFT_9673 [Thermomyces stellatus]
MATAHKDSEPGGLKVIHAGYMRTGTASMAAAYRTLGYRVHHSVDDLVRNPWSETQRAAEAKWPELAGLPDYTYGDGSAPRTPFARHDWDSMWRGYDIATDLAVPFTLELIRAYPDAKVVVVERDFESWWESMNEALLDPLYGRFSGLRDLFLRKVMGVRGTYAMRKVHAGFFGAGEFSRASITEERARRAYEAFYREVREAVPRESGRRLEYRLGDGWAPLCEFLGKEVPPDVEFPRLNDRASMARAFRNKYLEVAALMLGRLAALAVPAGVLLYFVYGSRG